MADLLIPTGRLVGGHPTKGNDKDAKGNPLVVKSGPNKGNPIINYGVGVAIQKGAEQSWKETEWGQIINNVATSGFQNGEPQRPDFAWKVMDGDSPIPNKKNKKPCDNPNYKNSWVIWFSTQFAPQLVNSNGQQQLTQPDAIKLGYYVQVFATVNANGDTDNPGVYLNQQIISLQGYGEEIHSGPDAGAVGFGGGGTPAGMSDVPTGGGFNPAPTATAPPPAPGAATAPPPAPVSAPQTTPKANGASYDDLIEAGWTHEQLVQHGMIIEPHGSIL
jgi:hypothetical protein